MTMKHTAPLMREVGVIARHAKSRVVHPKGIPLKDQLGYAPLLAQMVVTRRCNLQCGYCNEYDRHSPPVDIDILKRQVAKLRDLGTVSVEFTGGEPLMHPHIADLVSHASALNFPARMLITNAYLMTEDTVKRLNDAGLTHMQISIDGVKPNDVTVKVLDPLRKKLDMVAKHARFKVVVNSVIGAAPTTEVEEVFGFAADAGFCPRVLVIHDHEGQMKLDPDELQLFHRLRGHVKKLRLKDYNDLFLQGRPAPFKCRGGSRYLYISEHGMVHWCSQMMGEWGKPLMDYTLDDLRRQFYTPKDCSPMCTIGCARNASHYDFWRPQGISLDKD